VVAGPIDLAIVNRCRCVDQHERGSEAYVRCPQIVDGDHGYCMGCQPETDRDAIRQAVIQGAPLAGLSIAVAVATFDDMSRS
jgi:hypothetical protein